MGWPEAGSGQLLQEFRTDYGQSPGSNASGLADCSRQTLVGSCELTNIPPVGARKRPESSIPALSITNWLRGSDFELTTFGLCDLTQLSLRVGLYLRPA
jgi:hypothetical protein